jgi:hypothetical protein
VKKLNAPNILSVESDKRKFGRSNEIKKVFRKTPSRQSMAALLIL